MQQQQKQQSPSPLPPPAELAPGTIIPLDELRPWLKACGSQVKVYRGTRLVLPHLISIGDRSQIDEGVRIFGGLGVTIGKNVHLAFESSISGGGECVIGDFVGIGAAVRIVTGTEVVTGTGLTNPTAPMEFRDVARGRVVIGDHAVVFTNSVIFPNVTIGEGAVVAANSVVHRDLKPWCIYAGNPLVQVGMRDREGILATARKYLESLD